MIIYIYRENWQSGEVVAETLYDSEKGMIQQPCIL